MWTKITYPDADPDRLSMYPNPAFDYMYISTSGDLRHLILYNALGRLIKDEIITGKQYNFIIKDCETGIYLLQIETSAGFTTRILAIQK